MAKKGRARRFYGFARTKARSYSRRHTGMSGVLGNVIAGAAIGAGSTLLAPMVSQYIPPIAGVRPNTVLVLGGGVAAKAILHKGGKFADAAIITGAAMLAADLLAGQGSNGGSTIYL